MTIVSEMAYNKCNIIHLLISISRYEFYFDIIIVAQNIYSRSSERAESETFDAQPAPQQSMQRSEWVIVFFSNVKRALQ